MEAQIYVSGDGLTQPAQHVTVTLELRVSVNVSTFQLRRILMQLSIWLRKINVVYNVLLFRYYDVTVMTLALRYNLTL